MGLFQWYNKFQKAILGIQMLVTPITLTHDGMDLSLTQGRPYEVLGIESDHYRLLVDENQSWKPNGPFLFHPSCFAIIDPTPPTFWVCEKGTEGERYCYPKEWFRVGYFEDFHDGVKDVCEGFWKDLKRLYPFSAAQRKL